MVYLITGGTGSLGTALVRRLLAEGHKVRTYSRNEHSIERLQRCIPPEHTPRLSTLMGDVRDRQRIRRAARGVDRIIHAAAQKVIHLAEYDPAECVKTNVLGSQAVAEACLDAGVPDALLVSTDKASAPSTLYGATKLCAERSWLAGKTYSAGRGTRFRAIRYGNVWGSNGSVIFTFLRQYEAGSALTVTDPKMTRFHLRLPEAVGWCLRAFDVLSAGELLVPKLPSYSLVDLAGAVDPSREPSVTGRRPGEKLSESLISENESPYAQDKPEHGCYVLTPGTIHQDGGWEYTSSSNQWRLSREQLKGEIAWLRS